MDLNNLKKVAGNIKDKSAQFAKTAFNKSKRFALCAFIVGSVLTVTAVAKRSIEQDLGYSTYALDQVEPQLEVEAGDTLAEQYANETGLEVTFVPEETRERGAIVKTERTIPAHMEIIGGDGSKLGTYSDEYKNITSDFDERYENIYDGLEAEKITELKDEWANEDTHYAVTPLESAMISYMLGMLSATVLEGLIAFDKNM